MRQFTSFEFWKIWRKKNEITESDAFAGAAQNIHHHNVCFALWICFVCNIFDLQCAPFGDVCGGDCVTVLAPKNSKEKITMSVFNKKHYWSFKCDVKVFFFFAALFSFSFLFFLFCFLSQSTCNVFRKVVCCSVSRPPAFNHLLIHQLAASVDLSRTHPYPHSIIHYATTIYNNNIRMCCACACASVCANRCTEASVFLLYV